MDKPQGQPSSKPPSTTGERLPNQAYTEDAYTENDSFGGRVRRYARVGTTVGGLAARYAGNRVFGLRLDQGQHAAELTAALGGLKGPLMKVAQILATVPDVLPEEYTRELAQLQTNAPSMGWAFVKRRMATELGRDWQDHYKSFEHTACAAASLGQVHRAVGPDGQDWACKLQYPDMTSAVEADLRQLKAIFSIYRQYDKAIDPTNIHAELEARLREELDYRREAKHMSLYAHMLNAEQSVFIPEPINELSTDRLLTMGWLDGDKIMSFADRPIELRNQVAYNMFRAWYVPFYEYGVIHGDPHLGNYTIRDDGSVNLLDFGCIRIFRPSFIGAVIDLYWALRNNDQDLAVHAYETWGFRDLTPEMIQILNQWAWFLYRPLMEDKTQLIQEDGNAMYGAQVAGNVQKALNELGGVRPPREFVLMDRAAIGLGSVFTRLKAEMNWHNMFHELIQSFDVAEVERRQKQALTAVGLSLPV